MKSVCTRGVPEIIVQILGMHFFFCGGALICAHTKAICHTDIKIEVKRREKNTPRIEYHVYVDVRSYRIHLNTVRSTASMCAYYTYYTVADIYIPGQ